MIYVAIALLNATIETGIAGALLRTKKVYLFFILNCITNPLANYVYHQVGGGLEAFVWIEVLVFVVEAAVVYMLFPKRIRARAAAVAIIANAITALVSFII